MASRATIHADLIAAATGVCSAAGAETWDHGWAYAEYRRSANPAMSSPNGPVTLTGSCLDAYEQATTTLLQDSEVRARWHSEELWSVVGSLVVAASESLTPEDFVASAVRRLREVGPSLTVTLIANVKWEGEPKKIGNAVVGIADVRLFEVLEADANGRVFPSVERRTDWLDSQVRNRPGSIPPVAFAAWVPGQGMLADVHARRRMDDLVGMCLLLENDLGQHGIHRRGLTNRPGVRGLRLDRGALESGLRKNARIELGSEPMVMSEMLNKSWVSWNSSEPLPLSDLVTDSATRDAIAVSLTSEDPVSQSLRVAARWFTEAHYAEADDDAALALGVALDAMLTGTRALPGSAMADRYAMLSPNPADRKDLVSQYLKLYGVRSSVAHGGRSSKLNDDKLLSEYIDVVHQTARRCIAFRDTFSPASANEVDSVFDDLRWGSRTW